VHILQFGDPKKKWALLKEEKKRKMRIVSFDCGYKNLAFAVLEVDGNTLAIVDWRCIDTQRPGLDPVAGVLAALNELEGILDCSIVLIETQPRFAPLNVRISHTIASFFILRRRIDLDEPVSIHYVPASLKNRLVPRVDPHTGPGVSRKYAKYKSNKLSAIEACADLVGRSGSPTLVSVWEAFPKQDDAADSLLQAIAWSGVKMAHVDLRHSV
jgi:hypothetical protein